MVKFSWIFISTFLSRSSYLSCKWLKYQMFTANLSQPLMTPDPVSILILFHMRTKEHHYMYPAYLCFIILLTCLPDNLEPNLLPMKPLDNIHDNEWYIYVCKVLWEVISHPWLHFISWITTYMHFISPVNNPVLHRESIWA